MFLGVVPSLMIRSLLSLIIVFLVRMRIFQVPLNLSSPVVIILIVLLMAYWGQSRGQRRLMTVVRVLDEPILTVPRNQLLSCSSRRPVRLCVRALPLRVVTLIQRRLILMKCIFLVLAFITFLQITFRPKGERL